MRIRYVGTDDARDLAVAGGFLHFPRLEWVDVEEEAARTGIAVDHAVIVARSVVKQDDWESESAKKAAKTRSANAVDEGEQA